MISAKIREPESKLEFMEFTHSTTCIVGVPHGAGSELWVTSDCPCTVSIEAGGVELAQVIIERSGGAIRISDLNQPHVPQGGILSGLLQGALGRRHVLRPSFSRQRLYKFRAVVQSNGDLLATFDFHLLCEVDFHWARAYHLELSTTSGANSSVADRAEGTCPSCQEVRARLEKDWRYEV
jgi:hypothetical protein